MIRSTYQATASTFNAPSRTHPNVGPTAPRVGAQVTHPRAGAHIYTDTPRNWGHAAKFLGLVRVPQEARAERNITILRGFPNTLCSLLCFAPFFSFPMAGATPTPDKMRAVQYDACGGSAAALKHVEVPVPSAKKNEVLLKLEAASINPVDWKIQKGMLRPFLPRKFPFIPVTDVAGVVVNVGPGVNEFKAGDQVVAMLNSSSGGGLAEYAVASTSLTVKRPPEVSAAEGAGLPIAAGTALQALRSIGAKFNGTGKPTNVLITAASGGVGLYAVQLAKLANLHVTATCGSRNMELVKSLGADEVLDYRTPEGASLQSPSGRKYDGVVHCTVGIGWSTFEPLLSSPGKVIDLTPNFSTILTSGLHMVTLRKKRLVPLLISPNKADLEFLVGLVKEGKLKTVVDSRFPLSDAGKAWEKSIDGHATGKIIVEMEG